MIKPRETFHFNATKLFEGSWLVGLITSEVYNAIFNITEENNKIKIYKFPDLKSAAVSDEKVRDEIERDLDNLDITATDLQDDIISPNIIEEYREQVSKRMEDSGYMNILAAYTSSVFQDFESYLIKEVDLVADDIILFFDKHFPSFITYYLEPGIYSFRDLSESVFNILQPDYPTSIKVIVF